jgi:hypothetical protein
MFPTALAADGSALLLPSPLAGALHKYPVPYPVLHKNSDGCTKIPVRGSLPVEKGAEQTGDYPSYASGEEQDHWI